MLENIEPISLLKEGRYLILFQNQAEIRSSGGFIGSYGIVDLIDWQIKSLFVNTNIYTLDRNFAENHYIEAPEPINKMTKGQTWALRDANYDASFVDASQDILKFYQLETGDDVDGIIALTSQVLVDLLKITGPIYLEKYQTTITAENFYEVTQYKIEKEYYQNPQNWIINEPKTFLKDLYPEILKRAFERKIELARLIKKELTDKEIIFYFKDYSKQQVAEQNNWAGKIPSNQELKDLFGTNQPIDYLYINSNSYSGNKSSINIEEDIDYQVVKNSQGQWEGRLKISRVHKGSYVWPDGENNTWTRVFVPEGSLLLMAKLNGQDKTKEISLGSEAEKTFFGIEIITKPAQANILELKYLLPFKNENYHLLVQKQPGIVGNELTVSCGDQILFDGVLDGDKKL